MSTNKEYMYDDMLVKYLAGEATTEEVDAVLDWVAESRGNRKYFDDFSLIWSESKKLEGRTTVTADEAWGRFMNRVELEEVKGEDSARRSAKQIPLHGLSWVKAAAVLVVMAGAAWIMYTWNGTDSGNILAQTNDKVMIYTLPDGSVVTLNKHSELSYPAHFDGKTRSVALKGEAFFNITPDKEHPFIIDAGNSSVRVVGTSFNVKSRRDVTEVIVETGIVEVTKKERTVRLNPGQKTTITTANDTPVTENVTDELYNYYRTNEFVCNAVPLYKVVATLNDAYNAQILIESPRLQTLPLSATFPNESLDNIIDVIGKTFRNEMIVERRDGKVLLKERR